MDEQRRTLILGGQYKPGLTGRVVVGLVMMAFGVLWTLDNLGIMEAGPILRWWPLVIIALGVSRLVGIGRYRNMAGGSILTLVGAWLLAEQLGWIHMSIFALWPLMLVVFGVVILTRSSRPREGPSGFDEQVPRVSSFAFMGGVVRKVVSSDFSGGDATAMMGGVKLDLTGAHSVPGGAVLDVLVCWGGVDIKVPDTWGVQNQATVMLGGVEDRSKVPPADARDMLIIRGLVIMGGIEIKN
jgi:predicted membrane protein